MRNKYCKYYTNLRELRKDTIILRKKGFTFFDRGDIYAFCLECIESHKSDGIGLYIDVDCKILTYAMSERYYYSDQHEFMRVHDLVEIMPITEYKEIYIGAVSTLMNQVVISVNDYEVIVYDYLTKKYIHYKTSILSDPDWDFAIYDEED